MAIFKTIATTSTGTASEPVSSQAKSSAKGDPIIGIDLGTTNSLVAVCDDQGVPQILDTREGKRLLPSVVVLSRESAEPDAIGFAARERKVDRADRTVFSVKRLLGKTWDEVRSFAGQLPFKVEPRVLAGDSAAASEPVIAISAALNGAGKDRRFTPVEISAMILKELRLAAEARLETPVRRAVITVPAYFTDSQRQATRLAGRLAGLDVLRIINEPTAASLAYGIDKKRQGNVAVFDLGGGTFDISILKLKDGVFEVLSTNGDTALGGDDMDREIARQLGRVWGVDAQSLGDAELLQLAETSKIALTTQDRVAVRPAPGSRLQALSGGREYVLTREQMESWIKPIIDKVRQPCLRALEDSGLSHDEISDVVLVGGPSRMPIVSRIAAELFGREANSSAVDPEEVVALGAAVQADILSGRNQDLLLLDVVPLSLGIETYGGATARLIARNTKVPAVAREIFTTFVDRQTGVDIHVVQGESADCKQNRSLARFKLGGIEPGPAGLPRVEVTFLIDADGILQVSAKDLRTGLTQAIEIKPSLGLQESDVQRLLEGQRGDEDSAQRQARDRRFQNLVGARNEAERVATATEKRLGDAQRLLGDEYTLKLEAQLACLKAASRGEDGELIHRETSRLNELTGPLAEAIVKDAIARAGQTRLKD